MITMKKDTVTIGGRKFEVSQTLTAPNNPAVLAYLKAAREGKGLADKFFAEQKQAQKSK